MKNYHLITVRTLAPNEVKGTRIKLTSEHFEESVTIPYDYNFNNSFDGAVSYLIDLGHNIIGRCEVNENTYGIICGMDENGNFKSIK